MPTTNLVDDIVASTGYPRCIVSALVALSFPLRASLITFFQTYRAVLLAEKARLVGLTKQLDIIANNLNAVAQAGRAALAPVNTALSMIPFQQLVQSCSDTVTEIGQVVDNIPTTIPDNFFTQLLGIDGFDAIAGVTNYKSMTNKLNELEFRIQKSLTVSNYASKLSTDIDRSLSIIDKYLDIFSRMQ